MESLPDMCKLLRTKVFPNSPFSDHSDPSITPPASPRLSTKRLKLSSSVSANPSPADDRSLQRQPSKRAQSRAILELARTRSRSLSVSLEEERERSRSTHPASNRIGKKTLIREVSMTTVFKDKGKVKTPLGERQHPVVTKVQARKARETNTGLTLVKATPVKPKANIGRTRMQGSTSTLPATELQITSSSGSHTTRHASAKDILRMELEGECGEAEEDETAIWDLPNSPDVLLLGSQWRGAGGGSVSRRSSLNGHTLVEATPTKPHKC